MLNSGLNTNYGRIIIGKIIGGRAERCLSEMWGGNLGSLLVLHSRRPLAWRIYGSESEAPASCDSSWQKPVVAPVGKEWMQ